MLSSGTTYGGLGWPVSTPPLNLVQGNTYTLKYTVYNSSTYCTTYPAYCTVEAVVAGYMPPYTPRDLDVTGDSVSATPTTHTHQFTVTAAGGDPTAGVSLQYTGYYSDTVCFSNVSLVQN
jgi:hypothetical protein